MPAWWGCRASLPSSAPVCLRYSIPHTAAEAETLPAQIGEGGADRRGALRHRPMLYQADPALALALQHADQRRIAHRRQRMVAHPRFRQQHVADEQIAL